MSLAQAAGLYRQREQTATKCLDILGDRVGDTRVAAEPGVFCTALGFPSAHLYGAFLMHLCREKGKRFASAQGCYPRNIWEFSISVFIKSFSFLAVAS